MAPAAPELQLDGQPIGQVEDNDVFYRTSQILFDVNPPARQGETKALLGRDGAVQSTRRSSWDFPKPSEDIRPRYLTQCLR